MYGPNYTSKSVKIILLLQASCSTGLLFYRSTWEYFEATVNCTFATKVVDRQNFMKVSQLLYKLLAIYEFQGGGCRHLGFPNTALV
jgi:hypothetical protein